MQQTPFFIFGNLAGAIFLFFLVVAFKTPNLRSTMLFKFIPFLIALSLALNALKLLNII